MKAIMCMVLLCGAENPEWRTLRGALGTADDGVEYSSAVHKQENGIYVYTYRIKNNGKSKSWLVQWDLPQIGANYYGGMWFLAPGKEAVVEVPSKSPPKVARGAVTLYYKRPPRGLEGLAGFKGERPRHFFHMMGGAPGWLPERRLKQEEVGK